MKQNIINTMYKVTCVILYLPIGLDSIYIYRYSISRDARFEFTSSRVNNN